MMPPSSHARASKTENKPLCSSRASYVDHGVCGYPVIERDCWKTTEKTTDIDGIRWPACWWCRSIHQRTSDTVIRRIHKHVVDAVGVLQYSPIYVLGDMKSIEVHRTVALRQVRVSRIRFTPNPEADRGHCGLGRTNAAEDDLLGAGGMRSRGLGNRYREQQHYDQRGQAQKKL